MEAHPNFRGSYPLSTALGLHPVSTAKDVQHAGFDIDDVAKALGATRFASLQTKLTHVFSCNHRKWGSDHADPVKRNSEVHCVYAQDLEAFLKAGG